MGCHIRKQQKPKILDQNQKDKEYNYPNLKDKEYVYQIKPQDARQMKNYQWGEINLQSISKSTIMRRRSTTQQNIS